MTDIQTQPCPSCSFQIIKPAPSHCPRCRAYIGRVIRWRWAWQQALKASEYVVPQGWDVVSAVQQGSGVVMLEVER